MNCYYITIPYEYTIKYDYKYFYIKLFSIFHHNMEIFQFIFINERRGINFLSCIVLVGNFGILILE